MRKPSVTIDIVANNKGFASAVQLWGNYQILRSERPRGIVAYLPAPGQNSPTTNAIISGALRDLQIAAGDSVEDVDRGNASFYLDDCTDNQQRSFERNISAGDLGVLKMGTIPIGFVFWNSQYATPLLQALNGDPIIFRPDPVATSQAAGNTQAAECSPGQFAQVTPATVREFLLRSVGLAENNIDRVIYSVWGAELRPVVVAVLRVALDKASLRALVSHPYFHDLWVRELGCTGLTFMTDVVTDPPDTDASRYHASSYKG